GAMIGRGGGRVTRGGRYATGRCAAASCGRRAAAPWRRFRASRGHDALHRRVAVLPSMRRRNETRREVAARMSSGIGRGAARCRDRRSPRGRRVPTYWIAHPTESAFISAFTPEGVGEFLMISRRWPAGRYVVREHRPGAAPPAVGDRVWG